MTKFVNRLVEVGIGKESSKGTGVAATYWLPKTALTFDDKVNRAMTESSYGHITDAAMTGYVTSEWAEGDIEGEINVNSFGLILLALCGTDTPTLLETGVYSHDYTLPNNVTGTSLSIHLKDPVGSSNFRMAMINSLKIDIAVGKIATFVANFISKVHQDETAPTASYQIDKRFIGSDLIFKVANDTGLLSAATAISLKNFNIEIAKSVGKIDVLGTLEPEDIIIKGFKIKGSLELNYEDRTWRDYMLNNTVKAVEIKLVCPKLLGATQFPTLDMVFPKVMFDAWEKKGGLGDIAAQNINFEVYFDLANTRLWSTLQLINGVS